MTQLKRCAIWPLATVVVATLAGCASAPPSVLLTLPTTTAQSQPTLPMRSGPAAPRVLAVSRPEIPEYLVTRRVRYRADPSTLGEWPDTVWAERIEISVAREFNAALRQRLPDWRLCESNCSEQSPAVSLHVVLTRMDYLRSEQRLKASGRLSLWSAERVPRPLLSSTFSHEIAGAADTPQAQAEAMAALLERIATQAADLVAQGS